jgi:hypothetical protein
MKNRFPADCLALCRAVTDGAAQWFHSVPPPGEYPGGRVTYEGKPVEDAVVVIDREAYDLMLAAWAARKAAGFDGAPGVLVDREHFSLDTSKTSDAMAWATDIREDADGLWTRWDFTPPGRDLWENKIVVNRSPVLILKRIEGSKRFRPVGIDSIAMTNTPHFDLSALAAARAAEGQTQQGDTAMKKLLALLGLPETATEDEAAAAVQALLDEKAAAAQAKAKAEQAAQTAQAAARKARCDAFVAAHRDRISDEAAFREAYDKAPEATEAAFGLFKTAPVQPPPRISARDASTPGGGAADAPVTLAAYRAMPAGKAKDEYLAANKDTLLRLEREEKK